MASGNEKLQIDITAKDDASKVVDGLQKKVDKLEKGKTTVDLDADTKSAEREVEAFSKRLGKLAGSDQVVALSLRAAAAQTELQDITQELARLDANDPTIDIKVDRINQLTGDLDQLKAKIKEIGDTPLEPGGASGGTGDVARRKLEGMGTAASDSRVKVEGLTDSARGANSALANMVGNAAQDLGSLGGVVGSLGVGIGQMAEYAADATLAGEGLSSSLGSMARVALPIAGLAIAIGIVNEVMGDFKKNAQEAAKIKAFSDDNVKDFTKSLTQGNDVLDDYVAKLKEAGEVKAKLDTPLIDPGADADEAVKTLVAIDNAMIDVGVSATQYAKAVTGSEDELNGFTAAVKASNATTVNQQLVIQAATNAHADYVEATEKARKFALLFSESTTQVGEAQRRATEAARLQGQANEYLAQQVEDAATAHSALEASIEANAAQQEVANRATAEAEAHIDAINDKLQEHISKLQEDADALNGQASAFGSVADDQIAYNDALSEFDAKAKDSKASSDDIRDAAIGAAKAHGELYTSMTEASGAVATSTGKLDAQNASLIAAARQAGGPARQAIIDYIATLNGIAPEKATEIVATADTAQAEQDLKDASVNRDLTITADAKTAQAEADINAVVTKKRTAYVTLTPIGGKFATGGVVGPEGGIAGEKRPELIEKGGKFAIVDGPTPVSPGTKVYSGSDTARMMQAGDLGGGHSLPTYANGTQNITHVSTPPASAVAATVDVKDAAKEALRAQDKLKANAYELGRISREEYEAYLQQQMAGTADLSDEQVAYFRLIKGLQAETARESKEAADAQKKAADDAAKAAMDAIKAENERVTAIYRQAQAERDAIESESAHMKAVDDVYAAKTPEDLAAARERAGTAIYRTILARAKAAGLDEGSVEWDRFVRGQLSDADANTAGSGIGEVLARYFAAIPALASGGIVPATPGGQLVRVGEAGKPEAIVPLDRGIGTSVTNHYFVTIQALDPSSFTPRVINNFASALEKANRLNGRR